MDLSFLPAVNASLNGLATVLLVVGRALAVRRRLVGHRRAMLAAFAVSCLFLVLYVAHKASTGFVPTPYRAEGGTKLLYLSILFSHIVLAMTVPALAIRMIQLARSGRTESHRRLARWAWPIWMYVSITGVLIYAMLYRWNPGLHGVPL